MDLPRLEPNVLRYPPATRVTSVVLLVFGISASVVVLMLRGVRDPNALQVFLAILVLMLLFATVQVFGVAHRLVPGGIERVSPGRQRVLLRWGDMAAIQWVPKTRAFELESRRHDRVRVEAQLTNVERFARAALEGISPEVIDARPGVRRQLEELARGRTPPLEPDRDEWHAG